MIQKTKVYDKEAFILENKNISCTVIPSPGAKIVSLFDKRCSREWLVPPMRPVMEAGYESKFTDGSMGGWDEMLPTIDLCEWKGIQLPDHGEVWQVPWECSTDNDSLQTAVHCRYFPFIFSRNISLFSDDTFIFSYTLTNVGEKSYPWLWAAHPQFSVNLQTKICFPEDVKQLVNVINGDPVFGADDRELALRIPPVDDVECNASFGLCRALLAEKVVKIHGVAQHQRLYESFPFVPV